MSGSKANLEPTTIINLQEAFSRIHVCWSLEAVGTANGQTIGLVKVDGEFEWHTHPDKDKIIWVTRGALGIRFRDGETQIGAGELAIVPKGVEHQPFAANGETWIVIIEPS